MQFAVPQFTEVEDKLIGSLTLKQFLVLLAAGGIVLFFWSILGPSIIFFLLSLPVAMFGVGAALGRYNGRAMFTYIMPMAAFLSAPRVRVFRREVNNSAITVATVKPIAAQSAGVAAGVGLDAAAEPDLDEPPQSRLKKLAYLLDSKSHQQSDILSTEEADVIVVPTAKPKSQSGPSLLSQFSKSVMTKTKSALSGSGKPAKPKLKPVEPMQSTRTKQESAAKPAAKKSAKSERKSVEQPESAAQPAQPTQPRKFDPNSIFN